MQKILIFSNQLRSAGEMRSIIESSTPYPVTVTFDPTNAADVISSKVMNLVVYDTNNFVSQDYEQILRWRQMGYSSPILLATKELGISGTESQILSKRVHLLRKPFEEKELIGLTKKIIYSRDIPQQRFKRFRTDQSVNLEALNEGLHVRSSAYNLSKGGVYIEYTAGQHFVTGDVVRVKFELNDISASYTMNAKVVWTTKKGSYSGQTGCGLKFLPSSEMYRSMMEKM